MSKKVGRNDPCPCGSGKKYKNCCMLKEKETVGAKYTAAGKRKFKAKVLNVQDQSLSVFNRSALVPQTMPEPGILEKLKFRKTKSDFRKKAEGEMEKLPFPIPTPEEMTAENPEAKEIHLPEEGKAFKATTADFRKKQE